MSPQHEPVLLAEALALLAPKPGDRAVDATLGLGGHAEAVLRATAPAGPLLGIDRDPEARTRAQARLAAFGARARIFAGNFVNLRRRLDDEGWDGADLLIADLGVSSLQLDDPRRGFSWRAEAPLDLRMNPESGSTAADLLDGMDERGFADLLWKCGEEPKARRIARAWFRLPREERPRTTTALADFVRRASGYRPGRTHPATRVFQALRIALNDELGQLEALLAQLPDLLAPGGRAAVISFHSLEDRRVKWSFRAAAAAGRLEILTKKPVVPGPDEAARNPRSRSAKLRAVRRP